MTDDSPGKQIRRGDDVAAERVMKALDLKLADHGRHREMLKTIQWALIERRQLAGLYKPPYQDQPVERTLHPLRLCLSGQAWYLIARPVTACRACLVRLAPLGWPYEYWGRGDVSTRPRVLYQSRWRPQE
jgi:hypothetical protein